MAQLVRHVTHGQIDMLEKMLVPRTQVIQAGFPIRGFDEAVLRALAVASKLNGAFSTVFGKRVELGLAELALLLGGN